MAGASVQYRRGSLLKPREDLRFLRLLLQVLERLRQGHQTRNEALFSYFHGRADFLRFDEARQGHIPRYPPGRLG
jgi:hypothetical protein